MLRFGSLTSPAVKVMLFQASAENSDCVCDTQTATNSPQAVAAVSPGSRDRLEHVLGDHGLARRQAVADGGFASRNNLDRAKACGVRDMAFHKKSGLKIEDMVRSRWVYRKLRNFRAGIEAGISCLKRAYGLARCTWRGLDRFKAYVWSSVVAYNLALFARLRPD